MSRIREVIATLNRNGEKALGVFLTSGFPDPETTLDILFELDRSGADFLELGMPFSDPLGEGLPIQRSSERALRHGIRLEDTLETARAFRDASETPLLLMGYINPIYRFGIGRFCSEAAEAGVDGLILPDLPPEEGEIIRSEADASGLAVVHLIAPNTPDERIRHIDDLSTGFVYAVSVTGLTGAGLGAMEAVTSYLARARQLVKRNPLLVGFGIKTYKDAVQITQHTDGVIVGSAVIRLVERLWDDPSMSTERRLGDVAAFVRALKHGEDAVHPA